MPETTTPQIMVVDDDPCAADLASTILRRAGYDVVLLGDGESALLAIRETQPNLILIDLHLPGIDGCEVCRRVKAEEETRHIPIVVISADRTRESVLRALQAGADDFLIKPIDPQILTHKITSFPLTSSQDEDQEMEEATHEVDNRRRYVRFHMEAEAVLHLDIHIVDISEGGVGFLASAPVFPGSELMLRSPLFMEVLGVPEILVKVRYCRLPKSRTKYRLGGEFVRLGEAERKKIRQYVYRRQLARARPRDEQD